ncbi:MULTISPECIES: head decoration protein [Nocardia]|uniref:head decoration protein n=1 Tax=Nocardia TaxID=1817 RepID=UPI000D690205|nr:MULTISPECIES: head decoration protein [Nocardia]
MSNIAVRKTGTFYGDSRAAALGDISGQPGRISVTLDMTKFVAATQAPKGYLPSLLILGKVTATGLYGIHDSTASDGREVAAGFLWDAFAPSDWTGKEAAALWVGPGLIKESRLPAASGIGTKAKTDLAAWFKFY